MSWRPTLWAPTAARVDLATADTTVPCRCDGETWVAPVELGTGARYQFVVDGVVVPDPRSRSQPDGVHGPSEVVTAPASRPTPHRTAPRVGLDRAVIYELHVGTFSLEGTFLGAIAHLDHLVSLGITHVELMPVAAFNGAVGWGYDGVALWAPHPSYGTADDLRALVEAVHARGMAVLLDVVHNHLGPSGNYLSVSGPYFTDRYVTPWGDAVNLDGPGADGVRAFLIDSALYWLDEVGVDGLRLDAVHALFDSSAVHYLEQLADAVRHLARSTGRDLVLIAESDRNDPRVLAAPPVGPGLDAVWCDDLHHCVHVALTGERQGYYEDYRDADLADVLVAPVRHQGRYSPHRRRTVGRPFDGVRSSGLVVALSNHDQVGNRAGGERLHHLVGVDRAAAAAALTLVSPWATLLFQGEEWAASTPFPYFCDHAGELGDAVRAGRRREFAAFGWSEDDVADPQDPATFRSAVLRWDELSAEPHASVLGWYRRLVELARTHPELEPGHLPLADVHATYADGVARMRRGALEVVVNLGHEAATAGGVDGADLAEWGGVERRGDRLDLQPGAACVVSRSTDDAASVG